jgi:exopolysaccharide biosynthesis polyprenyl glycosylphosphotransferase
MFNNERELGFAVIGTVTVSDQASTDFKRYSLGTVDEIDRIIMKEGVEVTVLGMERDRELVLRLMTETAVADTTIKIIPDLYEIVSGQARAQHLYGMPLIEVNPQIMPPWEQHLKRILDVGFSISVLVLGLPVWLLTALAIKLEDFGPIFYSQERVGLAGKTFMIHKFRSMRIDAEKTGISWTTVNDPRVTVLGRFLRKLHIDEVPQFWNVLVGEMSIVGPRPERPFYVEKYTKLLPSYPRRLRVKPGLTGWNQVQAEEIIENVEFVQERLRHDFFYIENMSLRLDIEIIFRTIIRILQRKGQA